MDPRYPVESVEPFMVESRVPVGPSRVETHVIVPFFQAVITMALIGADVLLFQWQPVAGAVGAVGLVVWAWRVLLGDRLLWKLETITGHELDGTPGLGKPGAVTLLNPDQARRDVNKFTPAAETSDIPRMTQFVARCYFDGTSEDDQHIRPNTQERDNYVECRDGLLRLGLAAWKNPDNRRAGWVMTRDMEYTLKMIEKHVG